MKHAVILKNLFSIKDWQDQIAWEPFRDKVDIHWLYRSGEIGPASALIRFHPGGAVNMHEHPGFEHILILTGSQQDENGLLEAGSLMVHPPGTQHSITSEEGCIVLAIYEKRVHFTSPPKN